MIWCSQQAFSPFLLVLGPLQVAAPGLAMWGGGTQASCCCECLAPSAPSFLRAAPLPSLTGAPAGAHRRAFWPSWE